MDSKNIEKGDIMWKITRGVKRKTKLKCVNMDFSVCTENKKVRERVKRDVK